MIERIIRPPKTGFVLTGLHGSGKKTWLRSEFPDAYRIDLSDATTYQRLQSGGAVSLAAELDEIDAGRLVAVLEAQRLPRLLNYTSVFAARALQPAFLASSARPRNRILNKPGDSGLALVSLHPFTPWELGARFKLDDALKFGLLPIVTESETPAAELADYMRTYLEQIVRANGTALDFKELSRLISVAAALQGNTLNLAAIARENNMRRPAVERCLSFLEESLLCFRLPGFEAGLRSAERKHPKLYWCDCGVLRAARNSGDICSPEENGILFEGLVAQTLRAAGDYNRLFDQWFYWASPHGRNVAVDFLLCRGNEKIAIKVQPGRGFEETWCAGLRVLSGLWGIRRQIIVYPEGPRLKTVDDIEVLPFSVLVELLAGGKLWP